MITNIRTVALIVGVVGAAWGLEAGGVLTLVGFLGHQKAAGREAMLMGFGLGAPSLVAGLVTIFARKYPYLTGGCLLAAAVTGSLITPDVYKGPAIVLAIGGLLHLLGGFIQGPPAG